MTILYTLLGSVSALIFAFILARFVLKQRLPRETYTPRWRDSVRRFQAQVENEAFADPAAG